MLNLIAALLTVVAAPGGDVEASVLLEPPEIPFHRPARLTLTAEVPADLDVALPTPGAFDGLEVRDLGSEATDLPGGRKRVRRAFLLDPVQIRDYLLPPYTVSWDGGSLALPALLLRVRDLTAAEREAAAQFADISLPGAFAPKGFPPWAVALAASAVILACLFVASRWWAARPAQDAPPEPEAPWEAALRRLQELRNRGLIEEGNYDAFYVDLTAILRYYIEDAFQLHAAEQTTPEFLDSAARLGLWDGELRAVLANFLRHGDRVKFARLEPAREDMERGWAFVRHFINETRPRPPAEPAPAPEGAA